MVVDPVRQVVLAGSGMMTMRGSRGRGSGPASGACRSRVAARRPVGGHLQGVGLPGAGASGGAWRLRRAAAPGGFGDRTALSRSCWRLRYLLCGSSRGGSQGACEGLRSCRGLGRLEVWAGAQPFLFGGGLCAAMWSGRCPGFEH